MAGTARPSCSLAGLVASEHTRGRRHGGALGRARHEPPLVAIAPHRLMARIETPNWERKAASAIVRPSMGGCTAISTSLVILGQLQIVELPPSPDRPHGSQQAAAPQDLAVEGARRSRA